MWEEAHLGAPRARLKHLTGRGRIEFRREKDGMFSYSIAAGRTGF
jgi:hypothetical protein